MTGDLPLFGWRPPAATIIPFPAHLRVGKIARTAALLVGNTRKGAAYHWRRTIDDMRRQMERAGIEAAEIETQIGAFTTAVDVEVARRTRGAMRMRPEDGGAA